MIKPRARQLGIPLTGTPGRYNAITDVPGVTVGQVTLINGDGNLKIGQGPIRTGLTVIRPRGESIDPSFAGWYSLNGFGEMTGAIWLEESGMLQGPVTLTNTSSIGTAYEAINQWGHRKYHFAFGLPVVMETWDGYLNDVNGMHVTHQHVFDALDQAAGGSVAEGNVGGGTGMICHDFKGGIGSASRLLREEEGGYTVGVLVQANHGQRRNLTIAGVPVGYEITDLMPEYGQPKVETISSSIVVVVATDCPLLPHQLKRLARRVPLGIGRVGGLGENWSGDIFLAFSTAALGKELELGIRSVKMLPNRQMNPLIEAVVEATEEAILNALLAAETMTGINGTRAHALPHDRLIDVLKRYNRLAC